MFTATQARRLGAGAFGLVLSAAAIVFLATVVDVGATAAVLVQTHLGWLAATLLMVPAQILLRTWRWRLLLPRRPDGRRPSVRNVMPALLSGYLANLVLPARLGEPLRAYLVARREQLSLARVLGSVVLERAIDLASLAVVAGLAAVVVGAPSWMIRGIALVALLAAVLVALLAASGIARGLGVLSRVVGDRLRRVRALISALETFGEGTGGGGRRTLLAAIGLSTVTWFFVAGTFWLLGRSLELGISPAAAVLIAGVATLGTAIPSAPAYIGTYELATVVAAGALGIPGEQALALAILAHAVVIVPFAITGGAAVAWLSVSLTDVADEASEQASAAMAGSAQGPDGVR